MESIIYLYSEIVKELAKNGVVEFTAEEVTEAAEEEAEEAAEVVTKEAMANARKEAASGAANRWKNAEEAAAELEAKAEELKKKAEVLKKELEPLKTEAESGEPLAIAAYRDKFEEVQKADEEAAKAEAEAEEARAIANAEAAFNSGLQFGKDFYAVIMEVTPEDVEAREAVRKYAAAKGKAKKAAEELEAVKRNRFSTPEELKKAKEAKKKANAEKRDAAKAAAEKTSAAKEAEAEAMEEGRFTAFTFSGGFLQDAEGNERNSGSREAWARRPLALKAAAHAYVSAVTEAAAKAEGKELKAYAFYNFAEDKTGVLLEMAGTAYAHRGAKTSAFEIGGGRVWDMYRAAARGEVEDFYFNPLRADTILSLWEGMTKDSTAEAKAEAEANAERVANLPYHEAKKEKRTAAAWKEEAEYFSEADSVYSAFRRGVLPLAYVLSERRAYNAITRHFYEWGALHSNRGIANSVSFESIIESMERSEEEREAKAAELAEEAETLIFGSLAAKVTEAMTEAEEVTEEAEEVTEDFATYEDLYLIPSSYFTAAAEEAAELAEEAEEEEEGGKKKLYTVEEAAAELARKAEAESSSEYKNRRAHIIAEGMKAANFTASERRVIELLNKGYSIAEAAEKVGMKKGAADTLKRRAAEKLAAAIASTGGADTVEWYGINAVTEKLYAKEVKRNEVEEMAEEIRKAAKTKKAEVEAVREELEAKAEEAKEAAEVIAPELKKTKEEAEAVRAEASEVGSAAITAEVNAIAWEAEAEAEASKTEVLEAASEDSAPDSEVLSYNLSLAYRRKESAEEAAAKAEEAAGMKAAAAILKGFIMEAKYTAPEAIAFHSAALRGRIKAASETKKNAAEASDTAKNARAEVRRAKEAISAGKAAFSVSLKDSTAEAAKAAESAYFIAVREAKAARKEWRELKTKAEELETKAAELEAKAEELEAIISEAEAAETDLFYLNKLSADYIRFIAAKEVKREAAKAEAAKAEVLSEVSALIQSVIASESEARRKVAEYIAKGSGRNEAAKAMKKSKATVSELAKKISASIAKAAEEAAKAEKITQEEAEALKAMKLPEVLKKYAAQ